MPAPVPAEHELVEVRLDVLFPETVVDAERQPLEVCERPVDPRQKRMGGHGADYPRHVIAVVHSGIGREPVGQSTIALRSLCKQPGGLVGADAELRLKLWRGYAVRVCRDQMRRQKPRAQRQMGPVHHGAGRGRGLPAAAGTFPSPRLGFELPALASAASWAHEAGRPAAMRQPLDARGIVRKRRHELLQRRHSGRVARRNEVNDRNHQIWLVPDLRG